MTSHATRKFIIVTAVVWTSPASAFLKYGCESLGLATYRLGSEHQSSGLTIHQVAAGQVVANGVGARSGPAVVLRCWKGQVKFDHAWVPTSAGPVRPLTIGGLPSGLGLRASARGAPEQAFTYPAVTQSGGISGGWIPIGPAVTNLSNEAIRYEIVRMAGPLRFGRLDGGVVARSTATNAAGGGRITYRDLVMAPVAVNRPACRIVVGDLNQVVTMPEYTFRDFANADRATPWLPFHFRVATCPNPSGLIARFTFGVKSDGAADNAQWFSLPASGPKQIAMQLGSHDFTNVAPGQAIGLAALGNNQRYTFHTRLRQTGADMRGGRFSRAVRLTVEYL